MMAGFIELMRMGEVGRRDKVLVAVDHIRCVEPGMTPNLRLGVCMRPEHWVPMAFVTVRGGKEISVYETVEQVKRLISKATKGRRNDTNTAQSKVAKRGERGRGGVRGEVDDHRAAPARP